MQIRIRTVTVIDCETGNVTTHSDWRIEGGAVGLGPQLIAATQQLQRQQPAAESLASEPPVAGEEEKGSPPSRIRGLAYLVGVSTESTDQATARLGSGRVLEILEWMVAKRKKQPIKVPERLFWSLADKPSE